MSAQSDERQDSPPTTGSEARLLQGVLDPLLILNRELAVTMANHAFYETFGLTPEKTVERKLFGLAGRAWDVPALRERLEAVRDADETFKNFELTHVFAGVGKRTLLLNAAPLGADGRQQKERILLAMKDITTLRETQQARYRSERMLQLIFENAQEFAIIGMDLSGRVTAWNSGAERLLGYTTDEMLGRAAHLLFTAEDVQQGEADEELNQALDVGRAENERWHVRKDGSRFWGSGLVMPIYDEQDQPLGLLKIMRDMTAQHLLNEERDARERELERRVAEATAESKHRAERLEAVTRHLHEAEQRERRRLAQVLHDDLQQMLVAIKMRLRLARSDDQPEEMLQSTEQLLDQAIDATRSLSHELSPAVLREQGFVPALRWLGRSVEERFELPVKVSAREGVAERVPAPVSEPLFQMVRELLFNVVKHAEASEARVLVEPLAEAGLRVTVEDDGVGCDPTLISGEQENGGGQGLGLRGVRERLMLWQGELTCEPAPNSGCRVTLELPRLPTT